MKNSHLRIRERGKKSGRSERRRASVREKKRERIQTNKEEGMTCPATNRVHEKKKVVEIRKPDLPTHHTSGGRGDE